MSQVNVTINGRQFRMACEDGQEGHLQQLARELDERIVALRGQFGEIGGQLGTIGVQRVHLLGQDGSAALDFDPALHRGVKHVQRLGQAPGRGFDLGLIGHRLTSIVRKPRYCVAMDDTDAMKKCRIRNQLEAKP